MRVFLTGIGGGLGSLLAQEFGRMPDVDCITGIDVAAPKHPLPPKAQFVAMDIRSPELGTLMRGHDTVVHTAFLGLWPARIPADVRQDINVNGLCNVARAAAAVGVTRFIHASSTAAYDVRQLTGQNDVTEAFPLGDGKTGFYYGDDKALGEKALFEILGGTSTLLTILRPGPFVGPTSPATVQILRETAAVLPFRNTRAMFAHEEDVADAFIHAMRTCMPGAYNVAPDDFIRVREIWGILGMRVLWIPSRVMQRLVGVRWLYLNSPIHPCWVEARMGDFIVNNAKLKATGWKPRYGSAEALAAGKKG